MPTSPLTLQKTTREERSDLMAIFSDPAVVQYTNFRQMEDVETLGVFLDRFLQIGLDEPLQYGPYSIYRDATLIGLCGLQQKDRADGSAELWYLLRKDAWGNGYAKQAAELLLAQGRTNPQLKSIYAEAVDINAGSWRILENLGFVQTDLVENGFAKGEVLADLRVYVYRLL